VTTLVSVDKAADKAKELAEKAERDTRRDPDL
jgi:hypothetical protein